MASAGDLATLLHDRVTDIARTIPDGALAVSVSDYLSGFVYADNGDRWFHAASTIKVAIFAALFDAVADGRFTLDNRVHVRNRFLSAADGQPFGVQASRDADSEVHAAIGRTMRIGDLARHMIVSSSNLATNVLLDLIGLDRARQSIARHGLAGIDLQRGVEDDRAFEAGCNNRITANGAIRLLRSIHDGRDFAPDATKTMIEVLLDQQFGGSILPGLPEGVQGIAQVAHKTGDISTVSHDVGLVFLPGRPPYAIALLAESAGDPADRTAALTAASRAVYDAVAAAGETTWN
jgi:beta-lactamase class A